MILSNKKIHTVNIVAFLLLVLIMMIFLWRVPHNNDHYDLSLYPVIVTFTGVLHLQIGCFMVMNYWCYRNKSYLLPLACAFTFSSLFLFMALDIYYTNDAVRTTLYHDIAILYFFRHILLTFLFMAALYLYRKEEIKKQAARRLFFGLLTGCVSVFAVAVFCCGNIPLPINNQTSEWVFIWHGTLIFLLIVLWTGIVFCLIKQTRLKNQFWFSMSLVALANLVSLVIMLRYARMDSVGWYLARGIECLSAMAVMIALMSDIFRRYKASRQAYELSYENSVRDPMTRLYNRGYFYNGLGSTLKGVDDAHPLSLIFCDIDHFKSVNDTWGHIQGDRVIIKLAGMMLSAVRSTDIVARIGGEEFAVLLPDTDAQTATEIAERMRRQVEGATPDSTGGDFPRAITISLGVFCSTDSSLAVETFADFADRALYRAKNQGRNCVVTFSGVPDEEEVK